MIQGTPGTIFTTHQQSCDRVMLSVVSVRHSVHKGGFHVTITAHCTGPPSVLPPQHETSGDGGFGRQAGGTHTTQASRHT